MKDQSKSMFMLILTIILIFNIAAIGQKKNTGNPDLPEYKMTTPIPPGIQCPNTVESSLGTLNFFDGFPDDATVEKLYDNLDFQRAVQAYLLGMPAVSMAAFRKALTAFGPANITIPTWETRINSRAVGLTANCNTPYTTIWIDLHNGPLVTEIPPKVLGFFNDSWSRYVEDVGVLGPDKGQGGKYLVLPPGYQDEIPDGYFVVRSVTFECMLLYRHFAVNGDFEPALENYRKFAKVYLLSQAGNPPGNEFVNLSGKEFCSVAPADYKFWEYLNEVVQEEPVEAYDRVSQGFFASIGIEKGKPFAPDGRMKKILADAAFVGDATARAITYRLREKEIFIYEGSYWRHVFLGDYKLETHPGILNLDAYAYFSFFLLGNSPAEDVEFIDKGSQYAIATTDSEGNPFDGSKDYILHLPPNVPVKEFWSIIVYDYQTRSFLQTDQEYPMVSSQGKGLIINPDGSTDVYFGPKAPPGKESNWVQTIPGKGWFTFLRLYSPGKAWFDKTWRPGDITLIE